MAEAVICYPASFLERPEDRRFLMELAACGCSGAEAHLMLYRIWADYSTGKSDRRKIRAAREDLATDTDVRLMEDFCGWKGGAGDLVISAVNSGFLRHERLEGVNSLVCHGFFPINSSWCRDGKSFQKRGGLSRSADKQAIAADREARERETLWDRTSQKFEDVTPARRGDSLRFCLRVTRAMDIPNPTDEELRSGSLRMALEIMDRLSEPEIKSTLVWLIGNRTDTSLPRRLDQILRDWDKLAERAKNEMMQ